MQEHSHYDFNQLMSIKEHRFRCCACRRPALVSSEYSNVTCRLFIELSAMGTHLATTAQNRIPLDCFPSAHNFSVRKSLQNLSWISWGPDFAVRWAPFWHPEKVKVTPLLVYATGHNVVITQLGYITVNFIFIYIYIYIYIYIHIYSHYFILSIWNKRLNSIQQTWHLIGGCGWMIPNQKAAVAHISFSAL